jgi:hypothetical protein
MVGEVVVAGITFGEQGDGFLDVHDALDLVCGSFRDGGSSGQVNFRTTPNALRCLYFIKKRVSRISFLGNGSFKEVGLLSSLRFRSL